MDLNDFKYKLNYYFNIPLKNFLYPNIQTGRLFNVEVSKRGSIISIVVSGYDRIIFKTLENNFTKELTDQIINSVDQVLGKDQKLTVLRDTINLKFRYGMINTLDITLYICYGDVCPANFNSPILRSGIIPYFYLNGITYVILGVKVYREGNVYSDFGGGCKTSKKELAYDCANREMFEESLGILTKGGTITHIFSTLTVGTGNLGNVRFNVHQMLYFIDYTKELFIDRLALSNQSDVVLKSTTSIIPGVDEYVLIDIRKKYHEIVKKYQNPELEDIFIMTYDTLKKLPNSLLGENLYDIYKLLPDNLIN